jgi:nucleotide-binding universal stress UspA family protein
LVFDKSHRRTSRRGAFSGLKQAANSPVTRLFAEGSSQEGLMKRILAPTDGSPHSRKALAFAADLAKRYDAELLVAHVTNDTRITDEDRRLVETEYASEIQPALKRAEEAAGSVVGLPIAAQFEYEATATAVGKVLGEQLLKSAEDYLRERGAARVHTVLAHGDPAKTLLSIADEDNIDLIVIASHGHGEIQALLLGSVSNKVAHMARCPVLLVR